MSESLRMEFLRDAQVAVTEAPLLEQELADLDEEIVAGDVEMAALESKQRDRRAQRKDIGEKLAAAERKRAVMIELDRMIGNTKGANHPVEDNTPAKSTPVSNTTPSSFSMIPQDPRLRNVAPVAPMLLSPNKPPSMIHEMNRVIPHSQSQPQSKEVEPQHSQACNDIVTPQASRPKGPVMAPNNVTPTSATNFRRILNNTPEPAASVVTEDDSIQVTPRPTNSQFVPFDLDTRDTQLKYGSVTAAKGIPGFETVVLLDGKWTEISCGICGKNATRGNPPSAPRFITGVNGMLGHIRSHLQEENKGYATTFKYVKRREVSKEDEELMRAGKGPNVKIEMNEGEGNAKETPKKGMAEKRKTKSPLYSRPQKQLKVGSTEDDDEGTPVAKS